jgi:ubiquinone/menaquinone biosynthesis C-methylase UbiE
MSESQHSQKIKAYYDSEAVQAFYQLIWGGNSIHVGLYEDQSFTIRTAGRETVKKMIALLPVSVDGNTRILDMGAGYGGAARYVSWHYGAKVDCLDISEKQNEYNLKKVNYSGLDQLIRVVEGNFEDIPADNQSYDIVWCNDALLHCEDREKTIKEVNRVLKPGGWFVFTEILHGEKAARGSLKAILERLPVIELATLKDYQRLLRNAGFQEEQILEMPEHMQTHYSRVQKEMKREKKQLIRDCGEEFYKNTLKGMSLWIRGVKKGYLSWGMFLYRKTVTG